MIAKPRLCKTMDLLEEQKSASVYAKGFAVVVRLENKTQLTLKTGVYQGESYIPPSVRACIKRVGRSSSFFFTIDEENFHIYLHSKVALQELTYEIFDLLVEEFLDLAEIWRARLGEHGQQDLLPIHIYR